MRCRWVNGRRVGGTARDSRLLGKYQTYEDYLDDQVRPEDMYYLEDEELARQLVELGYRGNGETLKREEFEARKKLNGKNSQKSKAKVIVQCLI